MNSREEEMQQMLAKHRSSMSRSSVLEERLAKHRNEGGRFAQEERRARQKKFVKVGTERAHEYFVAEHDEAAVRLAEVAGAVATERSVRPALSFPSGILSLDLALGGGFPCGAIEIYGKESVGKTTLITDLVQSAQGFGKSVMLTLGEYFDAQRFSAVGTDLGRLILNRGPDSDTALSVAADFLLSGEDRVVFFDSATSIRPKDDQWANWAAMILAWLEDVVPMMSATNAVVMVNQVRAKRSVDPDKFFAGGTDSAAWRIARHFDTRLELSRDSVTDDEYDLVINIVASILSAPAKLVVLPVKKKSGIDVWKDVVRVASSCGVLFKNGSWYYSPMDIEQPLGQGEEETARTLENNPEFGNEVFSQALRAHARGAEG